MFGKLRKYRKVKGASEISTIPRKIICTAFSLRVNKLLDPKSIVVRDASDDMIHWFTSTAKATEQLIEKNELIKI